MIFLRVTFSLTRATCIEEVLTLKCSASSFRYASGVLLRIVLVFLGLFFFCEYGFFWVGASLFAVLVLSSSGRFFC